MKTILLFLLLSTSNIFGQIYITDTLSATDSTDLELVWRKFTKYFLQKDTSNLRNESLKLSACAICLELTEPTDDYYVPIDTFLFQAFRKFPNSELWIVLNTTSHYFSIKHFPDFQPKSLPNKEETPIDIYEVSITTNKPLEWLYNYNGTVHYFDFVKINGQYKFYGFASR